jgi:DNA-binding NarL/FixJ family response regulator
MKRMFIVGKDAFLVNAMRIALRYASDVAVFGVRDAGSGIRRALHDSAPDIVLLDGSDEPERTLDRVAMVREERPEAMVLVLATGIEADTLDELLEAGVTVCVARTLTAGQLDLLLADGSDGGADEPPAPRPLRAAVQTAAAAPPAPPASAAPTPSTPLTNRELEILRCVAEGHTNARIGRDLWVTEQTVKFHLSNIYRKLGVTNRTEASRYMLLNDPARARVAAPVAPPTPTPGSANGHGPANGHIHLNGRRFGAPEAVR